MDHSKKQMVKAEIIELVSAFAIFGSTNPSLFFTIDHGPWTMDKKTNH